AWGSSRNPRSTTRSNDGAPALFASKTARACARSSDVQQSRNPEVLEAYCRRFFRPSRIRDKLLISATKKNGVASQAERAPVASSCNRDRRKRDLNGSSVLWDG